MENDNLGNFFDAGDFGEEEENAENWKPVKVHGNALFKKSIEILNLTESLCDVLPDNEQAATSKQLMLQNAMLVPTKIKGAMGVDEIYSIVMESAVIIKNKYSTVEGSIVGLQCHSQPRKKIPGCITKGN